MIGAIVLATEQGLGYLAKDFYDNGIIDVVYIWEHSSRTTHTEWYDNRVDSIEELLDRCETIFLFETPFDWSVIPKARERGVKTVLMPMYECTHHPLPYFPDLILTPSDLDQQYYPDGVRINVPVPNNVVWKQRNRARVFVHNAGNGGLGGRNGTQELIDAMKFVKSPIKLIIRSQSKDFECDDERVEIRKENLPFEELYKEGDVFIFPEKFNGLSLPMQEAFASGMPVMCGNRFPMNKWLPTEIMIPVSDYKTEQIMAKFDSAVIAPQDIAKTIDKWYDKDISHLSKLGKKFKEENSWSNLKKKYRDIIKLC